MDEDEIKFYEQAGKIAAKAIAYGVDIIHEDMPVLELCEKVEDFIRRSGARPAFPCNVSINEVAAHYTARPSDTLSIPKGSLVKLDVGVHINGYIADTAVTISFSKNLSRLCEAARKALEHAISEIRPNVPLSKIGAIIENTIKSYGFKPISNLTGHKISQWNLHAGKSIPNVYSLEERGIILEGEVYAIEPFATNGNGYVVEGDYVTIFRYAGGKIRGKKERLLMRFIWKHYKSLPFCKRWLLKDFPEFRNLAEVFHKLVRRGNIYGYPVLIERRGSFVAQYEHTVIVLKDGPLVITVE
ncbi:MAG: type II methionyl aminopeptidase [Thermoprotei archaeon]|nr:MAG: type II methionyl aminopeptidase [Thermoprotei archaeon]RLF19883.1 MAG: type II methionyl aminopeptidase [Thermoprotei archaeon]